MRKISISGLVIVGLMAMGLGFANPTHAAGTLTVVPGGIQVDGLAGGATVHFCATSVLATACGPLTPLSYGSNVNGTYTAGSQVVLDGAGFVPLPAGTYTISIFASSASTGLENVTIGSGGGETSSESTPQPQTVALSINTVDGSTCRQSAESGFAGTWVKLPGADDCTPPSSRAGSTLLGWATNPNFPVDIAQRQVSNGWGAYETFNDQGQLTAVFIPAGGSTYLSGDGNLFAIWSN